MIRKKKKDYVRFKAVICPVLNVRSEPSTDSLIVKIILKDDIVECDQNFNNEEWEHVSINDVIGFCMKKFLKPCNPNKLITDPIIVKHWNKPECDGTIHIDEEVKDDKEE